MFLQNLVVDVDGLIELCFKALIFFFGGKFSAEFLGFWLFVRNVMSCPSPAVVAGFKLFQLAENVLLDNIVIHDALMGFICPDQNSDVA